MKLSETWRGINVEVGDNEEGKAEVLGWSLVDSDQFLSALTMEDRCILVQKLLTKLLLPQPSYHLLLQGALRNSAPLIYQSIMKGSGENAKDVLNKYLGTTFTGEEDLVLCVCTWLQKIKELA